MIKKSECRQIMRYLYCMVLYTFAFFCAIM
nr:MAG TPA: hypothetical protein [Caudoviricetes sp.]